jgi:hypothetical protein
MLQLTIVCDIRFDSWDICSFVVVAMRMGIYIVLVVDPNYALHDAYTCSFELLEEGGTATRTY